MQTEGCRAIKFEGGETCREVICDARKSCVGSHLGWMVCCNGLRTTYSRERPHCPPSHPGLKTDELLHLLFCLRPFLSS